MERQKNPKIRKNLVEVIKTLWTRISDVFRDYTVTMITNMLAALVFSILVEWDNHDTVIYLERTASFFLLTAVQSLTFEECFKKNWVLRGAGYAVSVILSIAYVAILSSKSELIFGMAPDLVCEFTAKVLAVHGTVMVGLAIWHMFRRLEEDFEIYATKAFLELLKATVIYGLFAGGLATIILIFNALIFKTGDFLEQVEIFLASGIYVPMCLKAISGKNEEPGKFFRVCILYVLMPMLLIAFGIIYLYIGKIFLTNDVPSNKIFFILSCLFTVGVPVWTTARGLQQKDGFLPKVARLLPYAFLPFAFLQCWALGIRIGDYGFTPDRYWGLILILCEFIYVFLYFLHHRGNKQAISWILFVLMGVVFLTVLCPGTSFEAVTIHSQMPRLTKLLDKKDLTNAEKASVKSSYLAIRRVGYNGKSALENTLTKAQKEQIESYDEYGYWVNENYYVTGYRHKDYVDVRDYSRIYKISSSYSDKDYLGDGKVKITYSSSGTHSNEDPLATDVSRLLELAKQCAKSRDGNFTFDGYELCPLDDTHDVWVTSIRFTLSDKDYEVLSVHLDGYLLEK